MYNPTNLNSQDNEFVMNAFLVELQKYAVQTE